MNHIFRVENLCLVHTTGCLKHQVYAQCSSTSVSLKEIWDYYSISPTDGSEVVVPDGA